MAGGHLPWRWSLLLPASMLFSAPAAAQSAGPVSSWYNHVERTAFGGLRRGNPQAAKRVLMIYRITCGHCHTTFSELAEDRLLHQQIASGKVSFEIAYTFSNKMDVVISALSECIHEPAEALNFVEATEAHLDEIVNAMAWKTGDFDPINRREFAEQTKPDGIIDLGKRAHFDDHLKHGGYPANVLEVCLTTGKNVAIVQSQDSLVFQQFPQFYGTPEFYINGHRMADPRWPFVRPMVLPGVSQPPAPSRPAQRPAADVPVGN